MQEAFFRDTAETGREDTIQAGTFGGLNTTANALNLPWADSPEMLNVDVSIGGNVVKRKGTRLLGQLDTSDIASLNQFRLGSGLSYVVAKAMTTMFVFEVINDELTNVATFANVWTTAAASDRAGVVTTNEAEPRMLFLTANNAPVQLHAVEVSERVTVNAATYSIPDEAGRYDGAVKGTTLFCYKNATRVPLTDFTHTSGTLTYNLPVVAGDVITFINFTWQWWAEAELYTSTRFYDVKTRFHTDISDRSISIPDTMRDGVELDTFGLYRIYAAYGGQGDRNESYFIRSIRPANGLDYLTSNGVINSRFATWDFPPVGSTHILFGDFTYEPDGVTVNQPYTLHLLRIRKLNLNGGRGVLNTNLKVEGYDFDDDYNITQAGAVATPNFSSYLGFDSNNWSDPDAFNTATQQSTPATRFPIPLEPTNTTTPIDYVTLDRGGRRGAPLNDLIRFINTERRWVGSAASTEINRYLVGGIVPAYGLGRFADYGQGLFPTTGVIYGGRLALGGVVSNPMRLIFSATTDSEFPGAVYQGFTIDPFQPIETTAFDINLAGSTSEIIQAMTEYQGSVFVATTESLYRIFSRNALNAQTALTQLTGKVGALNSLAFAVTAGGLFYLGRQGVYGVVPSDGLDDSYSTQDMSVKIRNLVDQPESLCSRRYSAISYDSETKKLYVSVYPGSEQSCNEKTKLYVLHTERMAWTEYQVHENLRVTAMTGYRDTNGSRRFVIGTINPANTKLRIIRTEWDWPIDFAQISTNSVTAPLLETVQDTQTVLDNVQKYVHKINTTGFNDVEDLIVTVNGEVLLFGSGWAKQGEDTIYLRETPQAAGVLTVAPRSSNEGQPLLQVYRNLSPLDEAQGYTQAPTQLTFTEVATNVAYMYGYVYITKFRTPVFSWNLLANYKRAIKWSGLFSNAPNEVRIGREVLGTMPDVDAQQIIGLSKVETDTNIAIIYNNERQGVSNYDVFRLGELLYDISAYDSYGGPYTEDEYVQIVEPLQGIGYSIQVSVWSYDRNTWDFAGYQLIAQVKGKRYSGEGK